MRLRLGQEVKASDGAVGELGDVVIDPVARAVTHIVAEPRHRHHLARLIPIGLVEERESSLVVALDMAGVRRLQRVAYSEFILMGGSIETEDDWDVGTQDVLGMPYWSGSVAEPLKFSRIDVSYDRIPKGECEIRRLSEVVGSDDAVLGSVEGFLVDGVDLTDVIVRTGPFQAGRVVPIGAVAEVRNDQIRLAIGLETFGHLPSSTGLEKPDGSRESLPGSPVALGANQIVRRFRHAARKLGR